MRYFIMIAFLRKLLPDKRFIGSHIKQSTNFICVGERHQHGGLVGYDFEMVEPAGRAQNCLLFDAFDDAKPMIRVNDLVTNQESHESPVRK